MSRHAPGASITKSPCTPGASISMSTSIACVQTHMLADGRFQHGSRGHARSGGPLCAVPGLAFHQQRLICSHRHHGQCTPTCDGGAGVTCQYKQLAPTANGGAGVTCQYKQLAPTGMEVQVYGCGGGYRYDSALIVNLNNACLLAMEVQERIEISALAVRMRALKTGPKHQGPSKMLHCNRCESSLSLLIGAGHLTAASVPGPPHSATQRCEPGAPGAHHRQRAPQVRAQAARPEHCGVHHRGLAGCTGNWASSVRMLARLEARSPKMGAGSA
eukprot:1159276-Pelagomonas_calceolata.AAC.5